MAKITAFPIPTTDQWASEGHEGLASPLCADVSQIDPSSGLMVSEYGIRKWFDDYTDSFAQGVNVGQGEQFFKQVSDGTLQLRRINPLKSSFTMSAYDGLIHIDYDGSPVQSIASEYVQGGSQQVCGLFLDGNGFGGGGSVGYSDVSIPLCANADAAGDTSPEALFTWNKDIAVGKIAIQTPSGHGFPVGGQKIYLGIPGDYDKFGCFYTVTDSEISAGGMWQSLSYSQDMYEDQYEYFYEPESIVAYTDGITIGAESQFLVRVFYDQVNYGEIDDTEYFIDVDFNDQGSPIDVAVVGDGYVEISWADGEYTDGLGVTRTIFNASDGSTEYYGDKDNHVKFLVSNGGTVSLYIRSLDITVNSGSLTLKYTKVTY